jgi:hypothetical protein
LKEAEQNTVGKPSFQNLNTPQITANDWNCRLSKVLSHKFETSTVVSKARIQF